MKAQGRVYIGVSGSGKDTQVAKDVANGAVKYAFADGVREIAWMSLGWKPANEQEYRAFKNTQISTLNKLTGQDFLINIGDGTRNKISDVFWVERLLEKMDIEKPTKFGISDCRYTNEAVILDNHFDVEFIFTNYKSPFYKLRNDTDSEWLAIQLLNLGYDHLDVIKKDDIYRLHQYFYDLRKVG